MKQFILTVLCVACIGFVGCSGGVPEVSNNSISDNRVVTVVDCPEFRNELQEIKQAEEITEKYNSAAVMVEIMNTLETNFKNAGFEVVRDDTNHITIK